VVFPVSDDNSDRKGFPYATVFLILANVFVFVVLQGMGKNDDFTLAYVQVPAEIISGRDELGVLLLGHDYTGWWTGTRLSIDEARSIVTGQSATTLQVAGSVLAALKWMIASPNEGVCVPDDLPWKSVLADARPYLGEIHSAPTDWDPLKTHNDLFPGYGNTGRLDMTDPWQFRNFLTPTPS